jgi:alkylation response protein AidB-like acyl-CoA dehydrogenase
MARGEVRAGVAVAGVRPGAREPLRAVPVDHGWAVDGVAPWVTGWGRIDVVRVAALDPDGDLVWLLVDAVTGPTLTVERVRLAALDASATVVARFDRHVVAGDRLVARTPYRQWQDDDAKGLRLNGSLALGVVGRCARLVGSAALERDLATCRDALDDAHERADVVALPAARAAASELAVRAAAAAVVARGAPAVASDQDAQRLLREAMFTLVFGSRPPMKEALLGALTGDHTSQGTTSARPSLR